MKLLARIDGACRGNPGPASVGVVIEEPGGNVLLERGRAIGESTNNIAEYTALEDALKLAAELGATEVEVRSDSLLLVQQWRGAYKVRSPHLKMQLARIQLYARRFSKIALVHVRRELNKRADELANIALDELAHNP